MSNITPLDSVARDPRSLLRALADRDEHIENVVVLIDEGDDGDPIFCMSEMRLSTAWWMLSQHSLSFAMTYLVPEEE